jgi:hypothetical protein
MNGWKESKLSRNTGTCKHHHLHTISFPSASSSVTSTTTPPYLYKPSHMTTLVKQVKKSMVYSWLMKSTILSLLKSKGDLKVPK